MVLLAVLKNVMPTVQRLKITSEHYGGGAAAGRQVETDTLASGQW